MKTCLDRPRRKQSKNQTKVKKWDPPQWFGEDVSYLILRPYMRELDVPFLYTISQKVMSNINMFGPRVVHGILGNINSRGVITPNFQGT